MNTLFKILFKIKVGTSLLHSIILSNRGFSVFIHDSYLCDYVFAIQFVFKAVDTHEKGYN